MNMPVFRVNQQSVVTRKIAGETIVVPVAGGVGNLNSIYTLNQSATTIWELLKEGTRPAEILSAICREYDVTEDEAARDIREFLDALQSASLIGSAPETGD